MRTRQLGTLEVSVIGLGCNNFGMRCDQAQTTAVVNACLDHGITFFDTADIYGGTKSEEFLGKALGARRDEAVVATKFGMPLGEGKAGASARWIAEAVEDSLRRLGTDRIDLYQQHAPDNDTPIEETLEALNKLVEQGKVREIGNSNFNGEMLEQADKVAEANGWAKFVTAQNQYNLIQRGIEDDVVPAVERLGLGLLPYFPLASGVLTGKYERGQEPPAGTRLAGMPEERRERVLRDKTFDLLDRLTTWSHDHGHTVGELAIAWLAASPVIPSVIAGATKPEQVAANAAAGAWELTAAQRDEVTALAQG